VAIRNITVNNKNFSIAYDIINPNAKKDIIFLHGWGSNKEVMKSFKDNFKNYRHIYIDMPGFGKSSNEYILKTNDYAEIIDKFIKDIGAEKNIVIGHSFGGKVATLLEPKLLVLLGSAGIILPKPFSVKVKIKIFKLLKKLGLSKFREFFVSSDVKGMSENMYETFKNVVDEDFSGIFAKYSGNALIFGGDKDTAVPHEAVKKQGKLLNSKIIMLNGDHYFFLNYKNREMIEREILNVKNHTKTRRFISGKIG
jgi:pimeloyl-ACP methyl ester carboxylesterase